MKAILRWGTACLSLLLLSSISHGYVWVTPVYKTPYPAAPGTWNSGFYSVDAYGRCYGPNYYLVPPNRPAGGMLPGPIGQAIMAGNLPHNLLMSKEAMSLGNAPTLEARKAQHQAQQQQQQQQQQGGHQQQQAPQYGMEPMLGSAAMQQFGMMQTPNAAMATGQYAMPMPYAGGMPYQQMQAPMGYGPKPMMWAPYPGQAQPPYPYPGQAQAPYPYPGQAQAPYPYPMPYPAPMQQPGPQAVHWRGPDGIWQVQNAPGLNGGPAPFSTIPGFQPGMAPPGQGPGIGLTPPTMNPQFNPMQQFGPVQQFGPTQRFEPMQPFDPLSRMQLPQPNMAPLDMPRMDYMPPQMQKAPGTAYPVHPFTRSPRDFFMWGDVMEQERARANRPVPVP